MARYTGPVWKVSRRLSFSVLETGKEFAKDSQGRDRRNYIPGQHGFAQKNRRPKMSNYGLQLREKQKIRNTYGLNEKQFRNLFERAKRMSGVIGENFLNLLESRLDNLVYRMGFAMTRRQARQLVNHGHILVNGKKVDIPSYRCKPGDTVELREKSRQLQIVKDALEASVGTVAFVNVDKDARKGTFTRLPERSELNRDFNELLVVEYYNR